MTNYLVAKLALSELDLLVFCLDILYIFCFVAFVAKFSHHFTNFRFNELLQTPSLEGIGLLLGCCITSVCIIMGSVVARGMHESLLNEVLSIATYTSLALLILISRKNIGIFNLPIEKLYIEETAIQKATLIYESSSILSGAILFSATLGYFYELNYFKIFMICIALEFFVEAALKLYCIASTCFNSYSLSKALIDNNSIFTSQIAIFRIHISLLVFAACTVTNSDNDELFKILSTIFSLVALFFIISSALFFLIDTIILKSSYSLNRIGVMANSSSLLVRFVIYIGADITIISLLR